MPVEVLRTSLLGVDPDAVGAATPAPAPAPAPAPQQPNVVLRFIIGLLRSELFWDWMSVVLTVLAMIPQGALGGLETDDLLRRKWGSNDTAKAWRFVFFLATFIASFLGKYALIRFFNEKDFKAMAHWSRDKSFLNFKKNFTLHGAWIGLLTLVMGLNFGSLAGIAFTNTKLHPGVAEYLEEYHSKGFDQMAKVVRNRWFQLPFVFASFFSNLLSFPNIYMEYYKVVTKVVTWICMNDRERTAYRRDRDLLERKRQRSNAWFESADTSGVKQIDLKHSFYLCNNGRVIKCYIVYN